ncbi:MAG: M23 family metallopeptidase [Geopsychrobacter sp.]|nr:M23 family metallopeptidase [Geopsychrobacter sp.]
MQPISRYLPHILNSHCRWLLAVVILFSFVGCMQQGVYHRVKPGQTLYRISKTYKVNEAYLARINGITDPAQLRVGARIYIPGAVSVKYVPATVPHQSAKSTKPASIRVAPVVVKSSRSSRKSQATSRQKISHKRTLAPVKRATKTHKTNGKLAIKLRWPLRGKILRTFAAASKSGGKGLEIAAREGSRVSAAAAGKVIYSGDGVAGYGHLMILQHENDIFTVYGFNSKNFVKQGQFVSQGERIASSGHPPSGGVGRLHFEVRVGKKAIDPILYLP